MEYQKIPSLLNEKSDLLSEFMTANWIEIFFFSILVFLHEHSRFTGRQGKEKAISLSPLYHFQPLHRHLDFSRSFTAEISPLHRASSRTRTGNIFYFRVQVANS